MYKNFGGMGNMQNLMRQAQKMQEDLKQKQAEAEQKLESTVLSASAGGGMVCVEITGKKQLTAIKIKPEAVDPDDVEMLEDMVLACVNEAIKKADDLEKELKPDMLGMM
jgi:DNA-binding YbaB/EbfC family protein